MEAAPASFDAKGECSAAAAQLKSAEWDDRKAGLLRLRALAEQARGTQAAADALAYELRQAAGLVDGITGALNDLRSSLPVEASHAVAAFAAAMCKSREFTHTTVDRLLAALLGVGHTNKVIWEATSTAIRAIVTNIPQSKFIVRLLGGLHDRGNSTLRERAIGFVSQMLLSWRTDTLRRQILRIENSIRIAVIDPHSTVRLTARRCALLFAKHFNEEGLALLQSFEPSTQNLLQNEVGWAEQMAAQAPFQPFGGRQKKWMGNGVAPPAGAGLDELLSPERLRPERKPHAARRRMPELPPLVTTSTNAVVLPSLAPVWPNGRGPNKPPMPPPKKSDPRLKLMRGSPLARRSHAAAPPPEVAHSSFLGDWKVSPRFREDPLRRVRLSRAQIQSNAVRVGTAERFLDEGLSAARAQAGSFLRDKPRQSAAPPKRHERGPTTNGNIGSRRQRRVAEVGAPATVAPPSGRLPKQIARPHMEPLKQKVMEKEQELNDVQAEFDEGMQVELEHYQHFKARMNEITRAETEVTASLDALNAKLAARGGKHLAAGRGTSKGRGRVAAAR